MWDMALSRQFESFALELHDILKYMFQRSLVLPASGEASFFLWGPRQTGKTTLLKEHYPHGLWIDLLKADEFRRYAANPEFLRQEIEAQAGSFANRQVVIDEIQKVPALLDEVHWLIENRGVNFALCGSSARKVRRGGANLLGGRAIRFELRGLSASELGDEFELTRMLNHGYIPNIYQSARHASKLSAYVSDYLKEEIAAEGLTRNLPAFSRFLDATSLCDGEFVNFSNIASECSVSAPTVKGYFEILEDTLIGRWLPAYRKREKRRLVRAPKFYFFDVGVVNHLARRGTLSPGGELYGKAFENWVFHELSAFCAYFLTDESLSYWRLAGGTEVDFILGDMRIAIEAKASAQVSSRHLRGLRSLVAEHPRVRRRVLVCLEPRARRTEDGIDILPAPEFVRRLWAGEIK